MGRGRTYKKEEDVFIQSSFLPIPEIALRLGRSYYSVASRIQYLKKRGEEVFEKGRKTHRNKGVKISDK